MKASHQLDSSDDNLMSPELDPVHSSSYDVDEIVVDPELQPTSSSVLDENTTQLKRSSRTRKPPAQYGFD
jgi:hypothetical protein